VTRALSGLSVLDFTTTIAGPHCTRLLADLGAEVIKIEAPEGDMMRSRMPLRNGASTSFGQLNAGKKSVVLDLKSAKAVEAVHRLAERARPRAYAGGDVRRDLFKAMNQGPQSGWTFTRSVGGTARTRRW
jgi:crotonobetainyl-CoA:carnitine CoA-transferase CaiB-like acyl-CoA transferase